MTAQWAPIADQDCRTQELRGADYNRIQFTPVETTTHRVTFTPQAGMAVGVKEIEAYNTGIKADGHFREPDSAGGCLRVFQHLIWCQARRYGEG